MAFEAQYPGQCQPDDICQWDGRIRVGDTIVGVGDLNDGRFAHSACQHEAGDAISKFLRERAEELGNGHQLSAADKPTKYQGTSISDMGY